MFAGETSEAKKDAAALSCQELPSSVFIEMQDTV
jgi:hypothetical protein